MIRPLPLAATALLGLAAAAAAFETPAPSASVYDHDAARAYEAEMAMQIDADGSGTIDAGELGAFGAALFRSMNESGTPSRADATGWTGGLHDIAVFQGRESAHSAAAGFVFDLFDTDGDGTLSLGEQAAGTVAAARAADRDGDGVLSRAEFRERHVFSIAARAAVPSSR
ncbi:EF-hand domain-containing protein [Jannaschia sp. W003]|uniref:EF-hand domain-containing protein n=1 Tax=Jannaschia sp. W003 TaxID=2867012 RepID=UPI0021A714F2|nr:EF-hand domain-containing protein [Jannaschia sp. W003]UWQ20861.1 EF-hand domain-containing protein [Jannaschia sp. W003]